MIYDALAGTASSTITPKGPKPSEKESQKSAKLPPCAACRMLTDSFKKGLERTSRSKFEGGDAAWEEEKMGSYKTSEVRLIEIQEHLCSEVERAQRQCEGLAEDHERLLEEWWFEGQAESLHEWLCIGKLSVCCPPHHYGPECTPCTGGAQKPCSGHGKCKGDGTRKGNGECQCDEGYNSTLCDVCASGYYESFRDDSKLLCSKCHKACNGPCTGAGPRSCVACKEGWRMETERGCMDVDECMTRSDPCPGNQFCVNNEGTFTCLMCDKACNGCNGDGPDMCDKCAAGYTLDESKAMCVDNSNAARERNLQMARYITYAGLTVATCIILQRHTVLAAVVGLSVAVYITASEYYLNYVHEPVEPSLQMPVSLSSNYAVDD
ncbi:protein of unknown function DUF3456 [Trinorchestia longiramus]|nr:protein of unknown function DUF3456 [Trinorchestia longiramus]